MKAFVQDAIARVVKPQQITQRQKKNLNQNGVVGKSSRAHLTREWRRKSS